MFDYLALFAATFATAIISGATGFGGALLLLPLLIMIVGAELAVPLLTIAQLIGNLSKVCFGFSQIQWKPVGMFLIGAVPFSIIGAISFTQLPKDLVTRAIGAAIFLFMTLQYFEVLKLKVNQSLLLVSGGSVGLLSGLVGSAGPLSAAIFLSLELPPVGYIASEATAAFVMHGGKIVVYQKYISLDQGFWFLATFMGFAMILGTWSANQIIGYISHKQFQCFVGVLLAVISIYMMIKG